MGHGDRKVLEDWVAAAIGGALPTQEGTFLVAKPVVGFGAVPSVGTAELMWRFQTVKSESTNLPTYASKYPNLYGSTFLWPFWGRNAKKISGMYVRWYKILLVSRSGAPSSLA